MSVELATPPQGVQPLAYRRQDLPAVVGLSMRLIDRLIASGEFPRPTRRVGRVSLWSRAVVTAWVDGGSHAA